MRPPSSIRRFGSVGAIAMLAALTLVLTPAGPAGAAPPPLPAPNSHGITLQSWEQVTPSEPSTVARLIDATIATQAIYRPRANNELNPVVVPIKVRILLPANYQTNPATPYPVLYLLHGGSGSWVDWANTGGVKGIVANSPFRGIVVMPEGGRSGWYNDWPGQTDGHFAPQWETFHIQQLVPWIDANFNTVGDRSGRAIAGPSMGGLGALKYAGAHPDVFSAVAGMSSGTNIREPEAQQIISNSMWEAGAAVPGNWFNGKTRVNKYLPFGIIDPNQTNQLNYRMATVFGPASGWSQVNPYDLADAFNAYDTRFALYSGGVSQGEIGIGTWNNAFHSRLNGYGVDHRYCSGNGEHAWGFWQEDLKDFLNYIYGAVPQSCPNGWGLPKPLS